MSLKDLRDELVEEVAAIFDGQFSIAITETKTVPQPDDPVITFPNLDTQTQGAKLITTCVLYIDMRKSTDLSFAHRPQTVAKLYTAFVRAMTRTARQYGGHVRGIIGDRVMVLFDVEDCFANAVHCAIAMNTVAQHIINKHFKANEVRFGIGIDHGRMLVTKAGIRRHGSEQGSYKNLVWLGRPANVASKLTDAANKPAEYATVEKVNVAYETRARPNLLGLTASGMLGLGALSSPEPMGGVLGAALTGVSPFGALNSASSGSDSWEWVKESLPVFLSQLEVHYVPSRIVHKRADFGSFFLMSEAVETKASTPPILMTKAVWQGFRRAEPDSTSVQQALFKKVDVTVPGYTDDIFGGQVEYPQLRT
ncbi:adenylate/guanylate cyclase domain-containing protein [Bradyrhizobium sp. 159]|uniref:adenylate/guanylate cyclase domain-containing protein n=1 Tax=Bradyrhizobium sp. 159 TaxID=2782632 RepID=UPI001FFBBEED|nr:adenylate/guanylate cyclase domain-containing protein [Bradyrhizobium sp. 159]MCK1619466.1 adenylate/guanylate cyclase domain-containing protein [Bradyrhizobium sp. 159]